MKKNSPQQRSYGMVTPPPVNIRVLNKGKYIIAANLKLKFYKMNVTVPKSNQQEYILVKCHGDEWDVFVALFSIGVCHGPLYNWHLRSVPYGIFDGDEMCGNPSTSLNLTPRCQKIAVYVLCVDKYNSFFFKQWLSRRVLRGRFLQNKGFDKKLLVCF